MTTYSYLTLIQPGWSGVSPRSINSIGQVVGYYYNGTSDEGFLYSNGIYTTLIDPLQGPTGDTYAQGINYAGQVTGTYYNGTTYEGFLYSNGTYTTLMDPLQGPTGETIPASINNSGQVTG